MLEHSHCKYDNELMKKVRCKKNEVTLVYKFIKNSKRLVFLLDIRSFLLSLPTWERGLKQIIAWFGTKRSLYTLCSIRGLEYLSHEEQLQSFLQRFIEEVPVAGSMTFFVCKIKIELFHFNSMRLSAQFRKLFCHSIQSCLKINGIINI